MNSNAFQALIALVDFDQKTVSFQKTIEKIKSEIAALMQHQKELEYDMQGAKDLLHDIQKEVDLGELEMKEYDAQIKEKKLRMDNATTSKEYASYQKEIQSFEKKQHESEGPLINAWNKLEVVKSEYKKKAESFEKNMLEISNQIQQKNIDMERAQKELDEHNARRAELVAKVPKEWLEKYEILGARVSDPIVPIESGSCSACFYDVTSQIMMEAKRGKLVQCKGCYRFLYFKNPEE